MAVKKSKTLLEWIDGQVVDPSAAGALNNKLLKSGIDTPEKLMKLGINELLQIKGIGRGSAITLIQVACDIAGKK